MLHVYILDHILINNKLMPVITVMNKVEVKFRYFKMFNYLLGLFLFVLFFCANYIKYYSLVCLLNKFTQKSKY